MPGVLHIEVYVVSKRHRTEFRRRAKKPIGFAAAITAKRGGSGPYFYRVDPPRQAGTVEWLGHKFRLRPDEDLWVELTFYPDRRRRRAIAREIWKSQEFVTAVHALEDLNSKRPGAWALANAAQIQI